MAKRILSKGQQRQQKNNHQRRLHHDINDKDNTFETPQEGTVISRFGQQADVEDKNGTIFRCNIRRTLSAIVTGDRVVWRPAVIGKHNGIIDAVHARTSLLTRPDYYDGLKPVAANIDLMVIISSTLPELSLNIIDRYLVAAEYLAIKPLIVLNKIDLLTPERYEQTRQLMAIYQQIGYTTLFISTKTSQHLDQLIQLIKSKTCIFVGQSGVGKSSLLNKLFADNNTATVGDISSHSGLGQHTTTTTKLYHLPFGANIIDSPGVREFGLWHLSDKNVINGFIEFGPFIQQCRFRDCQHHHTDDPHCTLQQALKNGEINKNRFNSYLSILNSMHNINTRKTFN